VASTLYSFKLSCVKLECLLSQGAANTASALLTLRCEEELQEELRIHPFPLVDLESKCRKARTGVALNPLKMLAANKSNLQK
jgi:hypothetical protein